MVRADATSSVRSQRAEPAGPPAADRGARPLAFEGFFQSVSQGLGEAYVSALMVWLGAGGLVLGLVGTLPTAATAFSQIVAAPLAAGVRNARRFIGASWVLQGLALAMIGWFATLSPGIAVPLAFTGAVAAWFLGGVSVPAWMALVSRTVPRARQGRFFGLRGTIQQLGVVVAILGGGAFLSVASDDGRTALGYLLLFAVAGLFRVSGSAFLLAVPDGGATRRVAPARPLRVLMRDSAKFRRLAVFLWSFHAATWVAAPFFLPYMLRDLQFDYGRVGLLIALPAVSKALTMRMWGRVADRIGPGPLLRGMGWCILPISALWLVSDGFWWIAALQCYAGLAWGAFELAQASALLQTTRGREDAIAAFNLVDGGALIAGSVVGGLIASTGTRIIGTGFLVAIAASTVLRVAVALLLLGRVRRIGRPEWSHRAIPLRLWGVRASRGPTFRPWSGLPPTTNGKD